MEIEQLDVEEALGGLKDFQRRTVDYVFRRMYVDNPAATRFLVADEVGLGKTLIAKGIIAKAVEQLRKRGVKRIDILYVCSNASIALQNLNKLNITDEPTNSFATRLTLLPKQLREFKPSGINFISFTPGTTFDLKGQGGKIEERALIYQMLNHRVDVRSRLLFRLLQCGAGLPSWRRVALRSEIEFDEEIAGRFAASLNGDLDFIKRLKTVCARFHHVKRVSDDLDGERYEVVGSLRRRLADVCIDALKPGLVILDEFQRFKDLLHDDEDDAAKLARQLFRHPDLRILLLSATPYRMLSMDHETDDDHYGDFLETLRFLFDNDEVQLQQVRDELRRFRQALYGLEVDASRHAEAARDHLETLLRSVIARTERIDVTQNAMIVERHETLALTRADLHAAKYAARLAQCVDAGDTIEYWKSSPYLANFMDQYELKRKIISCGEEGHDELHAAIREADGQLLRNAHIQKYRQSAVANPKLRALMRDTLHAGQWQWLWLPPSLPYIAPRGVYAQTGPATKSLVFSNWQVVPDSIAAMCSFEVERLMLGESGDLPAYRMLHKERRPLLQLRLDAEKKQPAAMPALALMYPCATLAATVDPLRLAIEYGGGGAADLDRIRQAARDQLLPKLAVFKPTPGADLARVDVRWYWAAPALLDSHFAEEMVAWAEDGGEQGLLASLTEIEDEAGTALRQHVLLWQDAARGRVQLGRQPDDLADVLIEMALGSPGICAVRAMQRVASDLPETSYAMLSAAVRIATGLRTLFNQPEVTAMLRADDERVPYWRRVLHYCIDGNLQAVLDEYAHMLREAEGLSQRSGDEVAEGVARAISEALSLRTSSLQVDDLKATTAGHVRTKPFSMRCRFALRFGDVRDDGGKTLVRSGSVRQAFNSPFRPFILASTSVGQEGLDFHPYCHVVYHWNLPANPVDLEQREGRVHRYKGHAIRRNVARKYGLGALRNAAWTDPWEHLFKCATVDRPPGVGDLVPYWLFEIPGGYSVERRVPVLPLSRDVAQFKRLKQMLALYRLAFGQPRQEDLLCYLADRSEDPTRNPSADLRLRLTPPRNTTDKLSSPVR